MCFFFCMMRVECCAHCFLSGYVRMRLPCDRACVCVRLLRLCMCVFSLSPCLFLSPSLCLMSFHKELLQALTCRELYELIQEPAHMSHVTRAANRPQAWSRGCSKRREEMASLMLCLSLWYAQLLAVLTCLRLRDKKVWTIREGRMVLKWFLTWIYATIFYIKT